MGSLLYAWLVLAMLTTSDAGKTFITLHEGVELKAYPDAVGVWTIGVGHTSAAGAPKVVKGMTITSVEAMEILARDLKKFEAHVHKRTAALVAPLAQHEFDALVSFCFNVGPGNFDKSSVLKHLKAGNRLKAADSLRLWNKAKGRVLKGLVRRRAEERTLFLTGVYTGVKLKGSSAR